MSTLNEVVATAATQTMETYRQELSNHEAAVRTRDRLKDSLLPLERKAASQVPVPEKPKQPWIEVAGRRMPRIDKAFICSATKRMGRSVVPAFAIYDVESSSPCEVRVGVDGTGRGDWHRCTGLSVKTSWEAMWAPMVMLAGTIGLWALVHWDVAGPGKSATVIGTLAVIAGCCTLFGGGVGWVLAWANGLPLVARHEAALSHAFTGTLPPSVRATANALLGAQKAPPPEPDHFTLLLSARERRDSILAHHRANCVLLVEEAYDWKAVAVPRNMDPLLIAVVDGEWYLADKFDVTPVEQWVTQEMTGSR